MYLVVDNSYIQFQLHLINPNMLQIGLLQPFKNIKISVLPRFSHTPGKFDEGRPGFTTGSSGSGQASNFPEINRRQWRYFGNFNGNFGSFDGIFF